MGGNFADTDFKYFTENILTDGHCLSPYTCKQCIVFKQFDRLNLDGLAGKRQNFPPVKILRYTVYLSQLVTTTQKVSCYYIITY